MRLAIVFGLLHARHLKSRRSAEQCELVGPHFDVSPNVLVDCYVSCTQEQSSGSCDQDACIHLSEHCTAVGEAPSPYCVAGQMPDWACNWSCKTADGAPVSCYNETTTKEPSTENDDTPPSAGSSSSSTEPAPEDGAGGGAKHERKPPDPKVISALGGTIGAFGAGASYVIYKVYQPTSASAGEVAPMRGGPTGGVAPAGGGAAVPKFTAGHTGMDGGVCQNQVEMYFESLEEIIDGSSSEEEDSASAAKEFQSSVVSKLFEDMIQPFAK